MRCSESRDLTAYMKCCDVCQYLYSVVSEGCTRTTCRSFLSQLVLQMRSTLNREQHAQMTVVALLYRQKGWQAILMSEGVLGTCRRQGKRLLLQSSTPGHRATYSTWMQMTINNGRVKPFFSTAPAPLSETLPHLRNVAGE